MKTIIISRTDKIGDVILSLPMVVIIKKHIPDCRIVFLCRSYTVPLIECCSMIDVILDWDELETLTEIERIKRLRDINADAIIHVFPDKRIARDAFKARIPLRIGTSHRLWHWIYCNQCVNFSRKKSQLHESQLNLKLLAPLGLKNEYSIEMLSKLQLFDCVPQPDETVQKYLDQTKFTLVCHPHSHGSAREWPANNYAELCNLLPEEKYHVVFCGTSVEAQAYSSVFKNIDRSYIDAGGKLSLKQYASLIAHSQGLIAASTGPLHIAAASGVHAFGLYPPIRPMHPGRWAPIGKNVHVFVSQKECSDCRKTMVCHCMAEIEPLEVYEKIAEEFEG
jgi:heptosyltransferase III